MEVTLALAILLGVGFLVAKAAQLVRLPSVTGYICAGLLLGPSVLNLVGQDILENRLDHFTQIALMLIAFGIGEHLDLRQLRETAKSVGYIGLGEASGAFVLVGVTAFFVAQATGVGEADWALRDFIALGLLLGAVAVATAPAATLHVMRELRASGPLTRTLMGVVAVDDGLAIMFFGVAASAARHVVGAQGESLLTAVGGSLTEIVGSLMIGAVAGLLMDFVVHRLKRRGEMLTVGLALLLLAGELARLLHMSPLLAGMAAGFTIVNRDRRDVRVFRAINDFEPPIYALFFTLAGAHLQISALAAAGALGAVYALLRVGGKITGANIGARLAKAPVMVQRWLGFALVPQAGVAIGLIFLIQGDEALSGFSAVITPVVLGAVVLSELIGPACARLAVTRAGEVNEEASPQLTREGGPGSQARVERALEGVEMAPWTWEPLSPPPDPSGDVILGVSHPATVAGLTRIAVLLAHHQSARALAVRVSPPNTESGDAEDETACALFAAAQAEARDVGPAVATHVEPCASVAAGILAAASARGARAIVLGHPPTGGRRALGRVVEAVGRGAQCPVIAVRFAGVLHTERILVPLGSLREPESIEGVVHALAAVGPHQITLLRMMPPEVGDEAIRAAEHELRQWAAENGLPGPVAFEATASEARVDTICELAESHDLLVMTAARHGLRRAFFGSLAEDVAQRCDKPMLMVHVPK